MEAAAQEAAHTLAAGAAGEDPTLYGPAPPLSDPALAPSEDPNEMDLFDLQPATAAAKSTGRRRKPTVAALAAQEEALEGERARGGARGRARKRASSTDNAGVSRTSHGGVKIGGRAVTWVGGAGIARELLDKMGIPQLRALFLKTFNHPTGSNNAEWLRKKLAQPVDPQVGAARAAVPRARDCTAEIWTTGTGFKGFTKQERYRLQQMGGNCAAKVVEVIKDAPLDPATLPDKAPAAARRRKRPAPALDPSKMHVRTNGTLFDVIGAETFNMPPEKRSRLAASALAAAAHAGDGAAALAAAGDAIHSGDLDGDHPYDAEAKPDVSAGALLPLVPSSHDLATSTFDGSYPDLHALQAASTGLPSTGADGADAVALAGGASSAPWRALRREDAPDLRAGCSVKVYRADERWHAGVIEQIAYDGSAAQDGMRVQIYYWEHDQSEERPLAEFFRGDAASLVQWQPPVATTSSGMPIAGLHAMQGVPVGMTGGAAFTDGIPMHGMPAAGSHSMSHSHLFGTGVDPGAHHMDSHLAGQLLPGVCICL